jgi:hypothetical protein
MKKFCSHPKAICLFLFVMPPGRGCPVVGKRDQHRRARGKCAVVPGGHAAATGWAAKEGRASMATSRLESVEDPLMQKVRYLTSSLKEKRWRRFYENRSFRREPPGAIRLMMTTPHNLEPP